MLQQLKQRILGNDDTIPARELALRREIMRLHEEMAEVSHDLDVQKGISEMFKNDKESWRKLYNSLAESLNGIKNKRRGRVRRNKSVRSKNA